MRTTLRRRFGFLASEAVDALCELLLLPDERSVRPLGSAVLARRCAMVLTKVLYTQRGASLEVEGGLGVGPSTWWLILDHRALLAQRDDCHPHCHSQQCTANTKAVKCPCVCVLSACCRLPVVLVGDGGMRCCLSCFGKVAFATTLHRPMTNIDHTKFEQCLQCSCIHNPVWKQESRHAL